MPEQPNSRQLGLTFAIAQVGAEMVVPIGAGIMLDIWLGWAPWLTMAGAALGLAGGLTHLVLLLNQADKDDRPTDRKL